MKRRSFLTRSALALPTLAGLDLVFGNEAVANGSVECDPPAGLSIGIVTDRPGIAGRFFDDAIRRTRLGGSTFRYQEMVLDGSHLGDVVIVQDGRLVNVWDSDTELAHAIRSVARRLSLPRQLQGATFLSFETGCSTGIQKTVRVLRGNTLLADIPLNSDREVFPIDGDVGRTVVVVSGGQAAIASSDCRHKTCMKLGAIRGPGQSLVCVPNQITVSIGGRNAHGIDGITG